MRLQGNRRGAMVLFGITVVILIILVVGSVVFMPR
jgi:Flp pilus assembly protein TadG